MLLRTNLMPPENWIARTGSWYTFSTHRVMSANRRVVRQKYEDNILGFRLSITHNQESSMNDKNIETPIPAAEQLPSHPEQFHTPMWVLTTFVIVSFILVAVAIRGLPTT